MARKFVVRRALLRAFHCIIRNIRRVSIYKRLILSFLSMIAIPGITISVVSISLFSKEINNTISQYNYKSLYGIDNSLSGILKPYDNLSYNIYLDETLRGLLRTCNTLSDSTSLSTADLREYTSCKQQIDDLLAGYAARLPYIANLEIVNGIDEFAMSGSGIRIENLTTFRNSAYYRAALNSFSLPVWWDTSKDYDTYLIPKYSTHMGDYLTSLRSITEPGSAAPLGVIVVNMSISALNGIVPSGFQGGADGTIVLMSDSGIISYLRMDTKYAPIDSSLKKKILHSGGIPFMQRINGSEYLITTVKSATGGWTFVSLISRDSLLKSVTTVQYITLFICLLCTVLVFFVSYLVTASICLPMNRLKSAMQNMDEAHIDFLVTDNLNDEIDILGQKFNGMLQRIQNLIHTVYEAEIRKKEEMIQRKEAELNALQMQINPHFLYNTLDIIRWQIMCEEKGTSKASSMISIFSELLRLGTLRGTGLVPLRDELAHIEKYIEVLKFDIEYALRLDCKITDERILDCKIPKLTLQPLVENAVVHGFRIRKPENIITVKAGFQGNDIVLEVRDNGQGIPVDKAAQLNRMLRLEQPRSKSIGLNNTNERIKLYFGDAYGLQLHSVCGEYTSVFIRLPQSE